MKPTIIFFGSFLHHSAQILKSLHQSDQVEIVGVVTTPPKPAGRRKELKKTDVHLYAQSTGLPIFTPNKLDSNSLAQISNSHLEADLIVSAGYGKLLPPSWLSFPKIASLNIHFSLLPKYRGAMPAEWALLCGESETGVTVMEMNQQLDGGNLISQASITIDPTDTRESLYSKLYPLGARLFLITLPDYLHWKTAPNSLGCQISQPPRLRNLATWGEIENSNLFLPPQKQSNFPTPYARLLSKDDSFIPWPVFQKAVSGQNIDLTEFSQFFQNLFPHMPSTTPYLLLEHSIRALAGYPNVWTSVKTAKGEKRLKILSAHLREPQASSCRLQIDLVQLEGLPPTPFNQIKNQII